MKIDCRIRGLPDGEALERRAERSLHFALGRFLGAVVLVRVTVEDVNGPRGGVDVRCKLRATLGKGGNPVLAEVLERDGIAAIDRASERLGRNLARRLSVKRKLRRARI